jgi:hypothetical protein
MSDDKQGTGHGEVTNQPAISTEEAAQTDETTSPVGDEKVVVIPDATKPETNDADVKTEDA